MIEEPCSAGWLPTWPVLAADRGDDGEISSIQNLSVCFTPAANCPFSKTSAHKLFAAVLTGHNECRKRRGEENEDRARL